MTPYDIAGEVAKVWGLDASTMSKADSSTFTQPAKRPPRTGFVIDKAKADLGYAPKTFTEGLLLVKQQLEVQLAKSK